MIDFFGFLCYSNHIKAFIEYTIFSKKAKKYHPTLDVSVNKYYMMSEPDRIRAIMYESFWRLHMTIRPLYDRVLIKALEKEETTSGGIIIPDTAKEKPAEGEIVAVGPGTKTDSGNHQSLTVAVGDRVLYGKWSGTDVKVDGEDFLIMKESDIFAIL
jgi:chaperonin GroES